MEEWPEERALILAQDALAELDADGRAYAEDMLFAAQFGIFTLSRSRAMLEPLIASYDHNLVCDLADAIKAAPFTDLERRGELYGALQMAHVLVWSESVMREGYSDSVFKPDTPHL